MRDGGSGETRDREIRPMEKVRPRRERNLEREAEDSQSPASPDLPPSPLPKRCASRILCLAAVLCLLATGCRQKMAEQPRYEPLEPSRFFADGQSARRLVPGVVARGGLQDDPLFFTGLKRPAAPPAAERESPSLDRAADYAEAFPIPITPALLQRGRERFHIYCAPCHGRRGTGMGPVVENGFPRAQSFHTDRLRQAPPGYLFDVITHGYQRMPSYAGQVEPRDRWAIIAYIRALQLSRHAELSELPDEIRQRFASRPGGEP